MKVITNQKKLNQIRKQHKISVDDFSEVTGAIIEHGTDSIISTQVLLTEDKNPHSKNAEYDLIDYWL